MYAQQRVSLYGLTQGPHLLEALYGETVTVTTGCEWHFFGSSRKKRTGPLWGGQLEVLYKHLATQTFIPELNDLVSAILFVTIDPSTPSAVVYDAFSAFGHLGYLAHFSAILVGPTTEKRAILRALREYVIHLHF